MAGRWGPDKRYTTTVSLLLDRPRVCVTPFLAEVCLALYIQQARWSEPSHSSSPVLTARQNGVKTGLQPVQETGLKRESQSFLGDEKQG